MPSIRRASVSLVLLFGAHAASAACVISGVKPTVALPTMDAGQDFSFIATADCAKLRFRVPGTTFVAIPKAGPDRGTKDRTYKVVLSESEWSSLVDEGDTTFTWSIIGTTSAGATTRVTTTNELKDESVTIDLSMADAKLVGEEAGDYAGLPGFIAGAGDVDGDGRDDLLIGAPHNDWGVSYGGAAYLVRGPVTGTVDLSTADAKLLGQYGDQVSSVAGPGDVNGDGWVDLLIGAPAHPPAGAAYVVLGPVTGDLDLSLADATLLGNRSQDQNAGEFVSGAGDVDDDGRDDLLVMMADYDKGHVYMVLGPVSGTLDLSLGADATFVGERTGDLLLPGSGAGDVDADGHDDVLLGAFANDEGGVDAGAAYLVLGPVTGTFDVSLADAKLVGEQRGGLAGAAVAGAGDVDNDGHDDLLVGSEIGTAYLVLGPVTGTRDLSLADAKLVGASDNVSGAGDVDGDGHDDLLLGAAGAALVLGPVSGTFDLSLADAKFVREDPYDNCCAVTRAGDVDADGRADIFLGAGLSDDGGTDAGAAYLVYGGGLF